MRTQLPLDANPSWNVGSLISASRTPDMSQSFPPDPPPFPGQQPPELYGQQPPELYGQGPAPPPPTPAPVRLAEGVTVERQADAQGFPLLRVVAEIPFPWRARPPVAPHRPNYPGSAVLFEDRWWEVAGIERDPASHTTAYRLSPWPESEPLRQSFELHRANCERHRQAHFEALKEKERGRRLGLAFFFTALLPAEDQRELASRHGLDPVLATAISSAVLTMGSVAGLLLAFAFKRGLPMGGAQGIAEFAVSIFPILLYLAVEGLVRLSSAMSSGEPMGSALVVVPMTLLRALGSSGAARAKAEANTKPDPWASRAGMGGPASEWMRARDRVEDLPPSAEGRARLRVVSLLPKNHWLANVHGIDHGGRRYILVDRQRLPQGESGQEEYVFELEETTPEQLFRFVHVYQVEEVREVYKARQRMRVGTWIETFAFLWGTTRPEIQHGLAEIYPRYDPWRAALRSTVVFGLLGLVGLGQTALAISAGNGQPGHLFLGLVGLVLTWEAAVRGIRLSRGELADSLLGPAFEALVRPALRWRRAPDWPHADV